MLLPPNRICCKAFLYASKTTAAPWIKKPARTNRSSPIEEIATPRTITQTVNRTRREGSGLRIPILQHASRVATGPIACVTKFFRSFPRVLLEGRAYLEHLYERHAEVQVDHIRQYQTHTEAHPNRKYCLEIQLWVHLSIFVDERGCASKYLSRDSRKEHCKVSGISEYPTGEIKEVKILGSFGRLCGHPLSRRRPKSNSRNSTGK